MSLQAFDLYGIARSVVAPMRLQPADRDDAVQEAVVGMLRKGHRLDESQTIDRQRGYLATVGRSKAMNFLSWRARSGREVSAETFGEHDDGSASDGLDAAQAFAQRRGSVSGSTPEDHMIARSAQDRISSVLDEGYKRLSSQEAALYRFKLGLEPMREDLVRLGRGPRGSVSNRARRKLMETAEAMDAADVVTPELLLRLFGPKGD